MENTIDNYMKFAALNIGHNMVMTYPKLDKSYNVKLVGVDSEYLKFECPFQNFDYIDDEICPILLKSLTTITNEDALEVAKFMGFNWDDPIIARGFIVQLFAIASNDSLKHELIMQQMLFDFSDISSTVDLLRSKGYAYKWMGISVEELVERGWIKLI